MLTAFARKFGPTNICDPFNQYAASFDGINDYAYIPTAGTYTGATENIWSFWIKRNDTNSADTNLRWFWGQSVSGNANPNFIRIIMNSVATNTIEFEFRWSSTSNSMKRQWVLHAAANQAITGSTSSASRWVNGNSAINTNTNGYVHLVFIYKGSSYGSAASTTDTDLYWNGQLMTQGGTPVNAGLVTNPGTFTHSHGLNINPVNLSLSNIQNAYYDSLLILGGGQRTFFEAANSIIGSTDQQLVDYIYNAGCPRDMGTDPRYLQYDFENLWSTTPPGGSSWTPVNGATFTSNHA